MKVRVKLSNGDSEIIVEANPRYRDFESITRRIVKEAIESALLMGVVRRKEK